MLKILFCFFLVFQSNIVPHNGKSSLVNTDHLDHLYEEVIINGDTLGIIHIYAEYPDYHWVDDDDEGTACVDDAARAMIFYLRHFELTKETASLVKTKKLLNFLFYMQAENGFFYNFIWKDNSINKDFKTSVAEPNWWSWRALWALAEANKFFRSNDKALSEKIVMHIKNLLNVSLPWLRKEKSYAEFSGFTTPAWLPYETAADQASIILKGLCIYYEVENDSSVIPVMKLLSKGIIQMQAGDENTFPHYAFLSWQNTWHAWGNSQADAILSAGKVLNDSSLIESALKELRNFYPYLIKENFYSDFVVEKIDEEIKISKKNKYPQIAYGFRPMIFAAVNAYQISNNAAYAEIAANIALWFSGNNINAVQMYSSETGRGYDGIVNEDRVNMNSGAESTIEALLSMLEIEKNKFIRNIFMQHIDKNK